MLRGLLRFLGGRRRYDGDANWVRPDLTRRTEATAAERVLRALKAKEEFGYNEREARAAGLFWTACRAVALIALVWFAVRSLLAVNTFAG